MFRTFDCGDSRVFVGSAQDISALYKSMRRAAVYFPLYVDFPRLVPGRVYGLDLDLEHGYYTVMNSNTILDLMLSGDLGVEVA